MTATLRIECAECRQELQTRWSVTLDGTMVAVPCVRCTEKAERRGCDKGYARGFDEGRRNQNNDMPGSER
jgi:hypothetical protein